MTKKKKHKNPELDERSDKAKKDKKDREKKSNDDRRSGKINKEEYKKERWSDEVVYQIDLFREGGEPSKITDLFLYSTTVELSELRRQKYAGEITTKEHDKLGRDQAIKTCNTLITLGLLKEIPEKLIKETIKDFNEGQESIQKPPFDLDEKTERRMCELDLPKVKIFIDNIAELLE